MKFAAWLFLTVSMALILYYLGYTPIIPLIEGGDNGKFLANANNSVVISQCSNLSMSGCEQIPVRGNGGATISFTNLAIWGLIGAVGLFAAYIVGFSAIYIIPLAILGILVNFFIFPWSFIINTPFEIPGMVIFNVITLLAVLNFVRGPT